jgi:AcrR family transcriptional regulator
VAAERRPNASARGPSGGGGARERILDTAYELFSQHGIRAVGIDRIVAESGVAKMTLYRHFASKEDLVLAFLALREQRWTRDWLEAEIDRLGETPRERVLAIFDAFDSWFRRPDFEGCSFVNTLLEFDDESHPFHKEAARQLDVVRAIIATRVEQAGAQHPEEVADQIQLLSLGAIVSAGRGDRNAARRARELAELLLGDVAVKT